MTDYYAVLKKAISGLEHETGDVRRGVYDKARTALIGQLKSIHPPLTTSEISRQRLELEEAIRKVEREATVTAAGPVPARARAAAAVAEALAAQNPPEPEYDPEPEAEFEPEFEPEYEEPVPPPPPPAPSPRVPARTYQPAAPSRATPVPRSLPDATAPIHVEALDHNYDPPETEPQEEEPDVVQPFWPQANPAPAPAQNPASQRPMPVRPVVPMPASWAPQIDPQEAPRGRQQPGRREPPPFAVEPQFPAEPNFAAERDEAPEFDSSAEWPQQTFEDAPTLDHGFAEEARERSQRAPRRGRAAESDRASVEKTRPSRWPTLVLLILIGLMLGGIAALAWSQRTVVKDVIGDLISTVDQGSGNTAPAAPGAASDPAASGKNADRLGGSPPEEAPKSVRTVDAGPAPDGAESDPLSGVVQPEGTGSDAPAAVAAAPEAAAPATSAAPAAAETSASGDALVAQRAILYEQPTAEGQSVTALPATVRWNFDQNSSNGPEIQAQVEVPDRQMKVTVNIRKNTDSALPASHLVEVIVDTPADFPGGGIKSVPAFVMKPTEEARGQPLDGAAAKVADGFFWIAFASDAAPMAQNIALMRERNWIDIPLVYDNDQRAILTLEKGAPGQRVFDQALAAWEN